MKRPGIFGLGNCVMPWLIDCLASFPELDKEFEIGGPRIPFTVRHLEEHLATVDPEEYSRCVLLLVQERMFGALTLTPSLRARLPRECAVIQLPTLTFSSLWPLVGTDPRDAPDPAHPYGRFPMCQTDRLALDVMRNVPDPAARRAHYLETPLASVVDLDRFHEIQAEQLVEVERHCDVRVAAHVLTRFRKERLFFAHHHPTKALLLHMLGQIFSLPAFAPFRPTSPERMITAAAAWLEEKDPFSQEQVPIHPEVARHFKLEWWSPDLEYEIRGRHLGFEQWLDVYMSEPLPQAPQRR